MRKFKVSQNKRYFLLAALALFLVIAVLWDLLPQRSEPIEKTAFAMGSALTVTQYGGQEETATEILRQVQRLEKRISPTVADSFTSTLNRDSFAQTDAEYADLLRRLKEWGEQTDGAFDITMGEVSALWDIGGENERIPAKAEIAGALAVCGWEQLRIDGNAVQIPEGMALDFGAVGKGMACDAAKTVLQADSAVTGAVVSSGGSVLLYGEAPDGKWTVGVQHPDKAIGETIAELRLDECFVSTSGNYQKYFMSGGKRYCHIFSPETGYPADTGLKSVTVVSDSGALSDALSTACFVLGYEKSLTTLARFEAQAVFITDTNEVIPTEGLRDALILRAA